MSRNDQKEQTRQRVVQAAARGFRSNGYGAIGVDGLARQAGVTSGAFYKHFSSKSEAFRVAVGFGMDDLLRGVRYFQSTHGADWWPVFVRFYLNDKRTCDLADSCSLQSLPPELARTDFDTRRVFEDALISIADAVVDGPDSPCKPQTRDEALTALCSLAGAVTIARAVAKESVAKQIADVMLSGLLSPRPR